MFRAVKYAAFSAGLLMLTACVGAPKVDPMSMQITPADSERVVIPNVCKSSYAVSTPRIAVTEFTNNTTYSNMTATNTNIGFQGKRKSVSAGAAGIVAAPGAVGVGYVGANQTEVQSSTQIDSFMRNIAPNIGEYAQAAVETTINKIGGCDMYDRKKIDKIMNEQKFQMTIGDPATAVKLGKMAGVSYIVTGTVDNITVKYVDKVQNNSNAGGGLGVFLAVATVAANTQTGWIVNVEMTVELIEVETGKILINEKVTGREVAGDAKNFNPEMAVQAAKKALGEAVDDIRPAFSERFAQKGYVQQLRGAKQAALINVGSEKGLASGQKLDIYEFIEILDPFTNAATCNMSVIPVEATVSDQVQPNQSWIKLEGKPEALSRVKIGSIIQRKKLSGQNVLKKMF